MTDYTKLVEALRICANTAFCNECPLDDTCENANKLQLDAAAAIEELQQKWFKSETDATNLTGKLAQDEADIDRLNLEIDKRIATEIELSNQVDALQAEVPKRREIVRCKECIHFTQGGWCDREFDWFPVDENDFCSMAEKTEVQE